MPEIVRSHYRGRRARVVLGRLAWPQSDALRGRPDGRKLGTAMAGDLGNGRFDGASTGTEFRKLNPANTLWSKQLQLVRDIDTEAPVTWN